MPEQRDIVIIPIPFTDLSSQKRRPVIVVSNSTYNRKSEDIVVVALTSNPKRADYSFTISTADLEKGKLKRPSKVRVDKIYALSQSLVINVFGRITLSTFKRIQEHLQELISTRSNK